MIRDLIEIAFINFMSQSLLSLTIIEQSRPLLIKQTQNTFTASWKSTSFAIRADFGNSTIGIIYQEKWCLRVHKTSPSEPLPSQKPSGEKCAPHKIGRLFKGFQDCRAATCRDSRPQWGQNHFERLPTEVSAFHLLQRLWQLLHTTGAIKSSFFSLLCDCTVLLLVRFAEMFILLNVWPKSAFRWPECEKQTFLVVVCLFAFDFEEKGWNASIWRSGMQS